MDEITLGGRVEFVTWIRVMDKIILDNIKYLEEACLKLIFGMI